MNKWWWWRWRWRETTTVWNVKGRRSKGVSDSGGATPGRARSNDLAGTSTALAPSLAPPCLLLCFGNSVNTKYKFYHIWPLTALFVLFWQWNSLRSSTFFQEKSASRWPGSRMFWPRNDLAPLLRWRRHWSETANECAYTCVIAT